MSGPKSCKLRWLASLGLAVITAAFYSTPLACITAAEPKPQEEVKPEKSVKKKAEKRKLTGAELYAVHCNRCHPERYPAEWTAAQWKTIMLEMRVRANLPAEQAKAILKYLREESGK